MTISIPSAVNRRIVLAGLAGSAAAAASAGRFVHAQSLQPIERRPIPHGDGEMLPIVGLGTSKVFEVGNDQIKRAELARVVRTLVNGGGSVVDTASSYGTAEEVLGSIASGTPLRKELFVATKLENRSGEAARAEFERSLRRLQVKSVDLLQLHNVRAGDPGLAFFRDLKAQKLTRFVGATTTFSDDYEAMEALIRKDKPDFIEVDCSIANRETEKRIIPAAADVGAAVLIALPFGRSSLFGKVRGKALPPVAQEIGAASWAQVFLKYLLGNPAITAVIPGTDSPKHMADNLGAGRGPMPDRKQRQGLVAYFEGLG